MIHDHAEKEASAQTSHGGGSVAVGGQDGQCVPYWKGVSFLYLSITAV